MIEKTRLDKSTMDKIKFHTKTERILSDYSEHFGLDSAYFLEFLEIYYPEEYDYFAEQIIDNYYERFGKFGKCIYCDREVEKTARICPHCGKTLIDNVGGLEL